MIRTIVVYGAIAGFITIGVMIATIVLMGGHGSMILGYLEMLIAFSMIFVGVKRYRDTVCGGVVKFGPALLVGLGIAGVAGVAYVIGWEIYLAATHYTFMDQYAAAYIAGKRSVGVTGAALAAEIAKMDEMKAQYANPLYRLPMTFMEIVPVGLLVALASAGLLRNPRLLPARA
ncbi:MAG TPA: DUF4199 domain-containing protein [Phenylobacterium sp.]